jgi:hypothetical protein
MRLPRLLGVPALYVVLMAPSGCGEERQRTEARAFLALYESLDHRQPAAVREEKLSALKQLTLVDVEVKRARDDCVSAHRALLRAEQEHESAAAKLDQAIAKDLKGAPLPVEQAEPIRVSIEQADRSLADARTRFTRCENGARSLSLRFRQR